MYLKRSICERSFCGLLCYVLPWSNPNWGREVHSQKGILHRKKKRSQSASSGSAEFPGTNSVGLQLLSGGMACTTVSSAGGESVESARNTPSSVTANRRVPVAPIPEVTAGSA